MPSTTSVLLEPMKTGSQTRVYRPADCITFRKTNEAFGGLSNMASGYALKVNGVRILTSEALYQACRFPHMPEVQRSIIMQASPMTAKMKSKPYRDQSRADWDQVRVKIMRWCLRVKLAQNWDTFGELLLRTGDKPIVEDSRKDQFWGAVRNEQGLLEGRNALGRLLMELREELKGPNKEALRTVAPLDIPDFLLYGQPIGPVEAPEPKPGPADGERRLKPLGTRRPDEPVKVYAQPARKPDLFSEPTVPLEVKKSDKKPGLPPYPAYKPAGVPWLTHMPEHWSFLRTKHFLREVNVRSKTGKEDLLSVSQYTGITKRKDSLRGGSGLLTNAKTLVGYKLVEPGDLVMNIMLAWRGSQAVSAHHGITSPAYSVFRVTRDDVVPEYLHYIYRTELYNGLFKTVSTGVMDSRLRLYPEVFFRLPTLLPQKDEQHLIVRYLHALDAKVKRYIRTKRKLIAALQEQKQAIIQRAVTRGLDPNVKLKPSGVEWLGEVPEHWRLTRIKTEFINLDRRRIPLSSDVRGKMTSRTYDYYGASGVIDKVADYIFDDELLLIAEDGANLALRNLRLALIARGKFWVNNHAHILKPRRGNIKYWAELLETLSYRPWITGAAQPKLTGDRLMGIAIAAPDDHEQDAIVEFFERETSPLTEAIERETRGIALMQEYHTRLIADVVTGAVDVREAARKLPLVDQRIGRSNDQMMEEESLSLAAERESEYGDERE